MCETPRWEAAHAGGQVWEARGRPPDGPGREGRTARTGALAHVPHLFRAVVFSTAKWKDASKSSSTSGPSATECCDYSRRFPRRPWEFAVTDAYASLHKRQFCSVLQGRGFLRLQNTFGKQWEGEKTYFNFFFETIFKQMACNLPNSTGRLVQRLGQWESSQRRPLSTTAWAIFI